MHALPLSFLRADVDNPMDQVKPDETATGATARDAAATRAPASPVAPAPAALDTSPDLARLSPAAARGLTHAYASRNPVPLTLGTVAYQVVWRVDAEPVVDAHAYRFVIGPAYGTLWIDPSAEVEWLGDAADPTVPAILRAALLADLCTPLTATLQTLTRQRVELLPPAATGADTRAAWRAAAAVLYFELRRVDSPWRCHGALQFDAPDALGVFFAAPPPHPQDPDARRVTAATFAALPIPLAFELGRTSLTAHEVADVVAGDIIAIEHWRMQNQSLLCAARIPAAPAWEIVGRPAGNRLIVERIREMPLEPTQSPDAQRAQSTDADGASPVASRQFDGLAVDLTFQLPPCSMPLGELSALQPGGVIELQQGINQSVINIVANGMLIGTGHLIAVGQKLGVRVTALTPPAQHTPRERQDG